MLGPCRGGMSKTLEDPFNVSWHEEITGACIVIPGQCDTTVSCAFPIFADLV